MLIFRVKRPYVLGIACLSYTGRMLILLDKETASALGALIDFGIFFGVVMTVHLCAAITAETAAVFFDDNGYEYGNDYCQGDVKVFHDVLFEMG